LWKFKNVVITPHIAGASDRSLARVLELLQENIRRFGAGEPLLNTVDKAKGY
jgi:phosphoglycerate dehydrogenase-like enzyme